MAKRYIFMYGFNKNHELRDVKFMIDGDITIRNTQKYLSMMQFKNPDVTEIYSMDGSWELTRAYRDLIREQAKDFTQVYCFWDYIRSQGLRLK